jgi:hypothetical protein
MTDDEQQPCPDCGGLGVRRHETADPLRVIYSWCGTCRGDLQDERGEWKPGVTRCWPGGKMDLHEVYGRRPSRWEVVVPG